MSFNREEGRGKKEWGKSVMVYLYAANIKNLPDPKEYPELLNGLWEERKQKTMRYLQPEGRKQSLAAGLLLKAVLFRHGAAQTELRTGKNGKPEMEGICFNLSHSDELVICAVSKKPVGCDVEKIKKLPKHVAERFFCESECRHLKSVTKEQQSTEFFRIWTMKESYMKMTGEGMSLPLSQFEMVFEEGKVMVRRDGKVLPCFIREYEMPDYKVTVCAKEAEFVDTIEFIAVGNNYEEY